jgi:ABC-type transport system involved in cytochrome c biogenesis permease subunit
MLPWAVAAVAGADDTARLDWSTWQRMPVFDRGRIMPLDSFARSVVQQVCGRTRPTLDPSGTLEHAEVRALFPRGKPRKFRSAELLFAWLVEPEKWEHVPFLIARHEQLRSDLLEVPLRNKKGHRLKHVSPRQVLNAHRFRRRLAELGEMQRQAQAEGKPFELSAVDEKVGELYEAYTLYRLVTFNPNAPADRRNRFLEKRDAAALTWNGLERGLRQLEPPGGEPPARLPLAEISRAMRQLVTLTWGEDFTIEEVDPLLVSLRDATAELAGHLDAMCRDSFRNPSIGEPQRAAMNELAAGTTQLAQAAGEMYMALYDNGRSLRLVPALNPAALKADRDLEDDNQPWLGFQSMMLGSDGLLRDYPQGQLQEVRRAFGRAADIYTGGVGAERPRRFAEAMDRFAAAVRTLGEQIEPLRRKLPIPGQQGDRAGLLAATAYPPEGYTGTELHYNRVAPFKWSWVVCLLSTVCFALSFGAARKPMFWAGILALTAAQGLIVYGFALRTVITGWAPVTNMFETIVFTALVVALLGLWFTLLPLTWPGITRAWRMAALPAIVRHLLYGWWYDLYRQWRGAGRDAAEAAPPGDPSAPVPKPSRLNAAPWILLVPRVYLMYWVFRALTIESYGSGGELPVIRLLPKTDVGSFVPTANDVLTWAVGLCVLVPTVLYVPRLCLAAVVSVVTVVVDWARGGAGRRLDEVLGRRPFAVVGAAIGFLASLLAYFSPIFDKDITLLMPILRDNFWLTMHVLSITASYGAGALAWGLGNVSLAYYLFGRYGEPGRLGGAAAKTADPAGRAPARPGPARRPPEVCATLAGFIYKATQVAVFLLAAGTILGALWADVAWGRFWGWDAKEVWALISLLAYSIILHGRYAGWSGDFGLAVGAVLGLTAIVMAWYGVNYVLRSGLHTYGGGSGGQWYVGVAVACNWLYLLAAAVRYGIETRGSFATSPPATDTPRSSAV